VPGEAAEWPPAGFLPGDSPVPPGLPHNARMTTAGPFAQVTRVRGCGRPGAL